MKDTITQNGRYYENGQWVTTGPLEIHKDLTYPNIGPRDSYLLYHEELESLVKNFPTIKRARFWMTFGQEYLTHLRVIQNIGMARIDEIDYNGQTIVAPPCRAFSTWLYSVSPFSQLRSVTAYKSRPFLSHFILCTFLQRLAVHVVDGVDDAVPVGGVAVFRFHMAPADLAGKSHRADSSSSGF